MRKLYPKERLSDAELQRRHRAVQARMKETGLELLLVSGVRFVSSTGYLRYLSNWAEPFGGECLILPQEGKPTFLARTSDRALLIDDLIGLPSIVGSTAENVAVELKRTGVKRIGIAGLKTMFADFYVKLTAAMPDVEFIDVSQMLDDIRVIKSEEELAWVRKSAELSDVAYGMFCSMLQEGATEHDIFTEIDHFVRKLGAETTYFMMAADPKPVAKFIDLAFDTYKKGDLVFFNAEIQGPGGYFTQLVRNVSLGEPSEEAKKSFNACLSALDAAVSILRPGCRAADLYDIILKTIEDAGCKMGLHAGHSQGLDIFEPPLVVSSDQTELREGMIIILHPHVRMSDGGGAWVGGTYLVTADGAEELQRSSKELRVFDA